MSKGYHTRQHRSEWNDSTNIFLSLFSDTTHTQCGIIVIRLFKGNNEGKAYLWNLHIDSEHRGKGNGRTLLHEAIDIARQAGCNKVTLEWDIRDSEQWVFDWYVREGFDEKEFGRKCALMQMDL